MGSRTRRNEQQLEEELAYHIATDWAEFRRFAPKKEIALPEAVFRFSEGPFWGHTIPSVPAWYLQFLCSGGENFLLWKDEALCTALSKMGYRRADVPPLHAPSFPPIERNAEGPGLHLESETDRGRSYDAAMKRKLFGFRNGGSETARQTG